MRVDNETLKAAVDQTWTKFNALPNLKIKMELSPPALAEGTEGWSYASEIMILAFQPALCP